MECPRCNFDRELDFNLFCTDCGYAFYQVYPEESFLYVVDHRVKSELKIENSGSQIVHPLRLVDTETGEQLCLVEELHIRPSTSQHISIDMEMRTAEPETINATLEIQLSGRRTSLPIPTLRAFPFPQLRMLFRSGRIDTEAFSSQIDEIFVGPTRGYEIEAQLRLRNRSFVKVNRISIENMETGDIIQVPLDAELRSHDPQKVVRVPFPPENEGVVAYKLSLWIASHNRPLIEKELKIRYLRSPEPALLTLRPTAVGYAYIGKSGKDNPVNLTRGKLQSLTIEFQNSLDDDKLFAKSLEDSDDNCIRWRIPVGKKVHKKLRVHAGADEDEANYDTLSYRLKVTWLGENGAPSKDVGDSGEFGARVGASKDHVVKVSSSDNRRGTIDILCKDLRKSEGLRSHHHDVKIEPFEQRKYDFPIGLDFGTTNTCLAISMPQFEKETWRVVFSPDYVELLPLDFYYSSEPDIDTSIVPSILSYTPRNDTSNDWFKTVAIGHVVTFAEVPFVEDLKSMLRRNERVVLEDDSGVRHEYAPSELITVYLTELFRRGMEYLEERGVDQSKFCSLSVAVPTSFIPSTRMKLIGACKDALRHVLGDSEEVYVHGVDESYAALVFEESLGKHVPLEEHPLILVVYDFGGGTTDLTAVYSRPSPHGHGRPIMTELAVSGGSFGGNDVNMVLNEVLKSEEYPEKKEVEYVKRYLDPRHEHILTDQLDTLFGDEGTDRLNQLKKKMRSAVKDSVETKVKEIVDDLFTKITRRLYDISKGNNIDSHNLPLYVLLAGNSSRLYGFREIIVELVKTWVENNASGVFDFKDERVQLIKEAKPCVAKGAFLLRGDQPPIEQRYIPHFSYLYPLPPDFTPRESIETIEDRRTKYMVLTEEGCGLDSIRTFDLSDLGIQNRTVPHTIPIFVKQGIEITYDKNYEIIPPEGGGEGKVTVKLSNEGSIELEWI